MVLDIWISNKIMFYCAEALLEYKEIIKDSYYRDKTGMLLMGDCLEWMPKFPDKSVDMILCDLPYGTTACKWDAIIPLEPLWKQYERIIKDKGAIVLTASQPFTSALVMSNPKIFKYEWIYQKSAGSNFATLKYQPMKEHESVLVFSKQVHTYYPIMEERLGNETGKTRKPARTESTSDSSNGEVYGQISRNRDTKKYGELRNPSSIQRFNNRNPLDRGLHPTQKPVSLFEYLIKTYTLKNEIVLDNCAGSCTTAVASKNLNRRWICIEKEQKYCDISVKRIKGMIK